MTMSDTPKHSGYYSKRLDSTVPYAIYLNASSLPTSTVHVKVVKNTMSQIPDEKPVDNESVPPVLFEPALKTPDGVTPLGVDEVKAKCTDCEEATLHLWFMVTPWPVTEVNDFMLTDMQKNTKRVVMCSQCGKFSLKN